MSQYVNQSDAAEKIRLRFAPEERCHSNREGDCFWDKYPQEANGGVDYQSYCCPLYVEHEEH